MFLFRATFWLAVVSVLVPAQGSLPGGLPGLKSFTKTVAHCDTSADQCAHSGDQFLDTFKVEAIDSLRRVKADLAATHVQSGRNNI